jgi:hypothetical protein
MLVYDNGDDVVRDLVNSINRKNELLEHVPVCQADVRHAL